MDTWNIEDFQRALGDALLSAGRLDSAALDRALRLAEAHGERLPAVLTKLGLVSEGDLARALAEALGVPLIEARHLPEEPVEIANLSPKFLRQRRLLPVLRTEDGCVLAMADPLDEYSIEAFRLAAGEAPIVGVAEPGVVERAIDELYGDRLDADGGAAVATDFPDDVDVERLKDLASEAPVIKLVNSLIARAVEERASDIHIEPFENEFRVRYRIDGVLQAGT